MRTGKVAGTAWSTIGAAQDSASRLRSAEHDLRMAQDTVRENITTLFLHTAQRVAARSREKIWPVAQSRLRCNG